MASEDLPFSEEAETPIEPLPSTEEIEPLPQDTPDAAASLEEELPAAEQPLVPEGESALQQVDSQSLPDQAEGLPPGAVIPPVAVIPPPLLEWIIDGDDLWADWEDDYVFPPGPQGVLVLTAEETIRIRVVDSQQSTLFDEALDAGTRQSLVGYPPFLVTLEHAQGLGMTYNKQQVELEHLQGEGGLHLKIPPN